MNGSIQKLAPGNPSASEANLQDCLGDQAEDIGGYGCSSWLLHRSEPKPLNIHMDQPNFGKLTSLHFHTWSQGLKTGMYYLRSRAAADAIKFTVDTTDLKDKKPKVEAEDDGDDGTKMAQIVCSLNNRAECLACGS